jgi:hypothetical protein
MAFTSPFFQGTQAQGIIDNYVNAGGYNQSFPSPSTNPYLVNSSAYVPPSSQPQPDPDIPNCEEAYPGEGRIYDPVMNACVLPEVSTQGNDREVQEEPYQGVGSINSPTQNAFMNLGLGSEYFDPDDPNKKLDLYGSGISGAFKRFTPFGQLGVYLDAKRLANDGVINQRDGGGYSWAKGGNLNLVKANQAFEQNLARQQGLNLDAVGANPLVYQDSLGNTFSQPYQQSRGDKADNMSNNVYRDNNANVSINPFKSNYGAKEIVSYSPPDPNRQKSASEKTFDRKQAEKGGQISKQSTSYNNKAR